MEDFVSTKLVEDSLLHEVTPIQEMEEFVPIEVEGSLLEIAVIEENNEGEMGNSVNVSENIDDPAVGMIFDSVENLFEYYKMYGKKHGFEVMKRTSQRI
ncbi:hypothetical protein LWI29_018890 [Acer saccharum]|uniref:Uncharacterized protein n=1 Tax=Acer saccharum TaxID=4024 RepID=A0AA39SYU6_ACESA|nr:hypothetical protein LWI29_018890 [Acer saccharum]